MRPAALAMVFVACTPRFSVPQDAYVACFDERTCPQDYRCELNIARCVPTDPEDKTEPQVTRLVLDRPALAAAKTITLRFDVSERLAVEPRVRLPSYRPMTATDDRAGFMYAFSYTSSGEEAPGREAIEIDLYDTSGNRAVYDAAHFDFDFLPPALTAVEALDPTTVRLTFIEPVTLPLGLSHFAASPALDLVSVTLSPDSRTAIVVTATQKAAISYALSVIALEDLAGNVIPAGTRATWSGQGIAAEATAPEILLPRPGDRALEKTQRVVWTAREGASDYTIDLATDAAFTQILETRTLATTETTFTVADDITHYVRVRADITAAGSYGTSRFEALDDVLYVFCASGAPCDDQGHAGNRTDPLRTIRRALSDSEALGFTRVNIADRGGGATYDETLVLVAGIDLYGGYDATFTTRSSRTKIGGSAPTTLFAIGLDAATTLDGLDVQAGAGSLSSGVWVRDTTALTVANTNVSAGVAPASYGIDVSFSTLTVIDSVISGPTGSTGVNSAAALNAERATVSLTNVVARAGKAATFSHGVHSLDSALTVSGGTLAGGTVTGSGSATPAAGLFIQSGRAHLAGATLEGGAAATNGSYGVYAQNGVASSPPLILLIEDCTLKSGAAATSSAGARLLTANAVIASSRVIPAGPAATVHGVLVQGATSSPAILFDTVIAPSGARGIESLNARPTVLGNLVAVTGSTGAGIVESSASADPLAVRDNFVFGGTLYSDFQLGACSNVCSGNFGTASCAQTLSTPAGTNNATTASPQSAVLNADFTLPVTSPARLLVACPLASDTQQLDWALNAADQADCTARMPGTTYVAGACRSTFLRAATEIMNDGVGNENLLCESNETCLFHPNAGAYAGHGALVAADTVTPFCSDIAAGPIQNVVLKVHGQNGN